MPTKDHVFKTFEKREFRAFCRENRIVLLSIFGSRARGDYRKKSDIDLLVKFKNTKSLLDIIRIEYKLADLLGKKVDLVTEGSVPSYLKKPIKHEAHIIYEER